MYISHIMHMLHAIGHVLMSNRVMFDVVMPILWEIFIKPCEARCFMAKKMHPPREMPYNL